MEFRGYNLANRAIQPYMQISISMFTCTFDKCGFIIVRTHYYMLPNATSSDDNIIAISNIHLSKESIKFELGNLHNESA